MTRRRDRKRRVFLHHMLKEMPGAKKHYRAYLADLLHYLAVTPREQYDARRVSFMGEAYLHARHRGRPKLVKLRWQDRECLRAFSNRCLYGHHPLTSLRREMLQRILTQQLVWLRAECVSSRQ